MFAAHLRMTIALGCALLVACGDAAMTTVRPPDLPVLDTTEQVDPPSLIAVRYALVRYTGAEGAPEDLERSREEALARASMLMGYARQPGQSFREVQTLYSDGPTAPLLIVREDTRLPEPVVAAAFGLRVGERSRVIEGPAGFYVVSREEDPDLRPSTVAVRHILIAHVEGRQPIEGVTRTREEARAIAEEVRSLAEANPDDFAALAAEYSDEPGAAERGGDLGQVSPGEMVGSFERAAFALDVGAVSAVVTSPFGYHVIYRYR